MLEQDKLRKILYSVLLGSAIYMLIKAGERADLLSALFSGWGK